MIYSAAFYNWEDQGVSDHEIKSTIQEFAYTSKVFFDQRNKKLTSHDCPLKKNSLLKDEWEAVLVQDDYQVIIGFAFVCSFFLIPRSSHSSLNSLNYHH